MTTETSNPPAETPATEKTEAKEETPATETATETATATPKEGEAESKPAESEAPKEEAPKEETPKEEAPPKATKPKPPPKDYGPIITDVQDMDVLSGRGAAVNNHPGNKKFRALCFVRKAHFDLGNHAAKRKLATEIVEILQSGKDHPPSRFLKRRPANALPAPPPVETPAATPAAEPAAPTEGETPAASDAAPAPSAAAASSAPLYYAMTKEQAILKAQQVMRDYKRPDRLEAKMLQQQHAQARFGGGDNSAEDQAALANIPKPHRARAVPSTPLEGVVEMLDAPDIEKDALFQTNPFGVHAHDILSGRGAYVNGHIGNARLRKLALERKQQFDNGNYTEKRQLASEIVTIVKSLDPPGRFLKKASKELLEAHAKEAAKDTDVKKEDKPEEAKDEAKEDETKSEKPEAALPALVDGVWEELSDDKAIHKACQVMRDISRPDRKYREERKEERLKLKRNNKRRKLNEGGRVSLSTEEAKEEAAAPATKEEAASNTVEDVVDKALLDSAAASAPAPAAPETTIEI